MLRKERWRLSLSRGTRRKPGIESSKNEIRMTRLRRRGLAQGLISLASLSPADRGPSIAIEYAKAALASDAPEPAPYPVQRGLTNPMRLDAQKTGDLQRMQAWASRSARLARAESASVVAERIWNKATVLLS